MKRLTAGEKSGFISEQDSQLKVNQTSAGADEQKHVVEGSGGYVNSRIRIFGNRSNIYFKGLKDYFFEVLPAYRGAKAIAKQVFDEHGGAINPEIRSTVHKVFINSAPDVIKDIVDPRENPEEATIIAENWLIVTELTQDLSDIHAQEVSALRAYTAGMINVDGDFNVRKDLAAKLFSKALEALRNIQDTCNELNLDYAYANSAIVECLTPSLDQSEISDKGNLLRNVELSLNKKVWDIQLRAMQDKYSEYYKGFREDFEQSFGILMEGIQQQDMCKERESIAYENFFIATLVTQSLKQGDHNLELFELQIVRRYIAIALGSHSNFVSRKEQAGQLMHMIVDTFLDIRRILKNFYTNSENKINIIGYEKELGDLFVPRWSQRDLSAESDSTQLVKEALSVIKSAIEEAVPPQRI